MTSEEFAAALQKLISEAQAAGVPGAAIAIKLDVALDTLDREATEPQPVGAARASARPTN